jgi:hypothetical protein
MINEMTISAGNLRPQLEHYLTVLEPIIITGRKIGNIEKLDVYFMQYENSDYYGIYDNEQLACFLQGKVINEFKTFGKTFAMDNRITASNYTGQRLSFKMFLFLKIHEKLNLLFGNVQSKDSRPGMKKIYDWGKFTMSWVNMKTGEKREYTPDSEDEFRSNKKPTGWQIMLESEEADWLGFSRWYDPTNFKTMYDWWFE